MKATEMYKYAAFDNQRLVAKRMATGMILLKYILLEIATVGTRPDPTSNVERSEQNAMCT